MKILPIIPNLYTSIQITRKQTYTPQNSGIKLTPPLSIDTVSFGRSATNAEKLRELMAYGIPDMYSGKNVIDPKILEKFYSRNLFSKSIRNIVKTLIRYENSLHSVEKQFFDIIKKKAKEIA